MTLPPVDKLSRDADGLEAEADQILADAKAKAEQVLVEAKAKADRLIADAELRARQKRQEARLLWMTIAGRDLADEKSSGNLRGMTDRQLQDRGRLIAKTKATRSKDRLLVAIAGSRWGSQDVYARKVLGIRPPTLVGYRNGKDATPKRIADRVKQDFGIGYEYWPRVSD